MPYSDKYIRLTISGKEIVPLHRKKPAEPDSGWAAMCRNLRVERESNREHKCFGDRGERKPRGEREEEARSYTRRKMNS